MIIYQSPYWSAISFSLLPCRLNAKKLYKFGVTTVGFQQISKNWGRVSRVDACGPHVPPKTSEAKQNAKVRGLICWNFVEFGWFALFRNPLGGGFKWVGSTTN